MEANIMKAPCLEQNLIDLLKIGEICDLSNTFSNNKNTFLKIMKYTKQSPTIYEDKEEYDLIFPNVFSTLTENNYIYQQELRRPYAFVALCKHESKSIMTFSNCHLFKRSFTNKGLGFTYNNAKVDDLIKNVSYFNEAINIFALKKHEDITLMKSASSDHALTAFIQYNEEAVEKYEFSKGWPGYTESLGDLKLRPTKVTVALHDPFEPANLRSKGIEIPLGHSTIVYFTPSARKIDLSGKELDENQRNCRLNDENSDLNFFNKYTQEGCLFECKLKIATANCGCIPWSYPMLSVSKKVFFTLI